MLNDHPISLPNQFAPLPNTLASGMPSEQDFGDAAKKGIKTVVNLCPLNETPPSEPAVVEGLGMRYVNIPVSGPQDLNRANAQQLADAMAESDTQPVLVHCRSSNRVGALLALKAFWIDSQTPQHAIELGRAAGLLNLEPVVLQLMNP
ncbi:serine/threonine protein phosphatase [Ketobacter sp. MCCC 1A13808]|uniref:beta-lactamase hydrolase domain-containing protein n=1 Tax=Ketobacter sp. MCCC 1A13808 TaxID=2602738 RepID=UPI000F2B5236|nr:sulfur transferase domain-containing protein [Ketobacter sp. MCCC 1A13808]MVF11606.1 serine/threonine protein phosphatase [Ketobacter sp. MCCC 1A13808]RLP55217.1 MAG: serine/threonine protein phosphatase [Ketobacter sp.]